MTFRVRIIRKRIKNGLIYVLIQSFVAWILSVPRTTAFKIMHVLGVLGFYLASDARKKTLRHLKWIYGKEKENGELKRMAREVFINLGRNAVDAVRLSKIANNIDRYVKIQGIERMDQALARGKGVLALTGHIGNWELLAAFLSTKGYPLNVVGAQLYDSRLNNMLVENRQKAGSRNITRGSATREIIRALRRGEIIGILIDQDTRVEGVFVDFLGRKAYTPVGPVLLAMKTGAALLPMAIHIQKDNTHLIEIHEEVKLQITNNPEQDKIINTQNCSKAIEHFIRQHPTQWVWMHERWKTQESDGVQ